MNQSLQILWYISIPAYLQDPPSHFSKGLVLRQRGEGVTLTRCDVQPSDLPTSCYQEVSHMSPSGLNKYVSYEPSPTGFSPGRQEW